MILISSYQELRDQLKQISVFNESDLKIIDTRKQSINKKVFINDKKLMNI